MFASYDWKMEKNVDNGGDFGALLTDPSKAFDGIPHDLIIAKLEAYGFHIICIKTNSQVFVKQKAKVNDA